MTEITFDTRIVSEESEVGIPEVVRHRTQLYIQHTKRITIEAQNRDGKYAKANGFKLTPLPDNDDYPAEEIEDVTEAIMQCVNAKFRERESADPTASQGVAFRIVFDRRIKGKRLRPSIELLHYTPDGPDLPIGNSERSDDDGYSPYAQLGDLVDKLMVRVDGLIGHIVTMSDQHKDMYEPLVKMMAIAGQNQVVGMEMQRRAMEYIYSTKRLEEEEAGKDRRAEKWMEFLKMPAKQAVSQFGKYMRAKAAGSSSDEEDDEHEEEETAAPSKPRQSAAQANPAPTSEEERIEHPCAAVAQVTGQLLEPGQWAAASQIMTKKQMRIFGELFESETDDQVIEKWDALQESLTLPKMLELNGLLTEKQQKSLEVLTQMVEKARAGWPDDDDDDAPSGAEG